MSSPFFIPAAAATTSTAAAEVVSPDRHADLRPALFGKLLSSQSALMFLTMGGYPALTGSGGDHRSVPSSNSSSNSAGGPHSSNTCIITTASSSSPLPHSSPYSTITSPQQLQQQQQLWPGSAARVRHCNSLPPPAAAESRSNNAMRAALVRSAPPPPPPSLLHHSSTVSSEFGGRCEDEGDSISLPRCSSVSSSTAGFRLPSSSSHQQLSDQLPSIPVSDGYSSSHSHQTSKPPQKKPRRVRASSGKLVTANGLVPSSAGAAVAATTTTTTTAAADAATTTITESTNNPSNPNPQCPSQPPALFSMGRSPFTVPPSSAPSTPQSQAPSTDLLTGSHQVVQQLGGGIGVSSSNSDPALSSKAVLSHHRTLSQLVSSPTDSKLNSSKARSKKKSFFERLTSPRKSFQSKTSKT
ncbi:hypothetical protein FHG87_015911 [Trinorchestia longiramus]|nr:hypothetical protein FHG87_015911 [Trinorchestia longiramus]